MTPELLAAFAAARSLQKADGTNRPVSARTLGRSLAALRSFLRYLERRGKTTGALRGSLPRVSAPQPPPPPIGGLPLNELMDPAAPAVEDRDRPPLPALAAPEWLYRFGLPPSRLT